MKFYIKLGLSHAEEAVSIRRAVFIEEQGFENEFDGIDDRAFHCVVFSDNVPAAAGRLYTDDGIVYHIGRVAVRKEFRGRGLGKDVVSLLERYAKSLGGSEINLSAQTRARGFYEKMGYTAFGGEYYDEFCPHIAMKKVL